MMKKLDSETLGLKPVGFGKMVLDEREKEWQLLEKRMYGEIDLAKKSGDK